MLQNNEKHMPDSKSTIKETMSSLCKPIEVSTVYNQRKALPVLSPPKITYAAYEPWPIKR
jgi:hypothetical protein